VDDTTTAVAVATPTVQIGQHKKEQFLRSLSETCSVSKTCEALQIPRSTVYEWRSTDKAFAEAWVDALKVGADALEDEAVRRAMVGVDEPVFYQGVQTGHVRKYSDVLLIFLLKGARPEKYKERVSTDTTIRDERELTSTERAARVAAILELARRAGTGQDPGAVPVGADGGPADGGVPLAG
jgi:hypothetical protein